MALVGSRDRGREGMGHSVVEDSPGRLGQGLRSRLDLLEPAVLREIGREPFALTISAPPSRIQDRIYGEIIGTRTSR